MTDAQATIAGRLRFQARACTVLGSPLYSDLLERAAQDVERGGPTWALLADHASDPGPSALALRLMGAVHRLVLEGQLPELARHYPSVGGVPRDPWPAFRRALEAQHDGLAGRIHRPVQTNEVGRCAALLPAFLLIARETGLALGLLEVGASAGLNLRWDQFHYRAGRQSWGPSDSPVQISCRFEGRRPSLGPTVRVVARRGCDTDPVDPLTQEGRLTLLSYVWADQPERVRLLSNAIEIARRVPATLQRANAPDWVSRELRGRPAGTATVVYHSIVTQYLSDEERGRLEAAIVATGERATRSRPLAWLRLEPAGRRAELTLTTWPGGRERRLARVGYHGQPVRWLTDSALPAARRVR